MFCKYRSEERDKKPLDWTLGKYVVRMGSGWNWLRIVSNGRLWY
jgi:hypothetical protein